MVCALVFFSESLLPMPCLMSWRVCWKEQTSVLCCYCPISPLCSIPPCPWRLDQRPNYPLWVSKAMVYIVPQTRACRPDRPSKTIFPEDVSENMTWMCLANPRFFCFAEPLTSWLLTLLCHEDRQNPLLSNLFALPLSTIVGEPKNIGAKSQ